MTTKKQQAQQRRVHDEFFKTQMEDKAMAQDFMRQFLPADLLVRLNLEAIELDKTEYVSRQLKRYFSDMVWICPFEADYETPVRIAILLEHKSDIVPYPEFQLLRYILEIEEKRIKAALPLTPVLPIIFYHGETRWQKRDVREYFQGIDDTLKRYIPYFDYILIDIGAIDDAIIVKFQVGLLKNLLLSLKHSRDRAFMLEHFGDLFHNPEIFVKSQRGLDFLHQMLVYLLPEGHYTDREASEMLDQIPEPVKKNTMTIFDQLSATAVKEATHTARREGKIEGKIEARNEAERARQEERKANVRNARLKGVSVDLIAHILNMTEAEVLDILTQLCME